MGVAGFDFLPGSLVFLGELPVEMPRGYGWAGLALLTLLLALLPGSQRRSWWIVLGVQVVLSIDPFYGSGGFLALIATFFVMHREWVPPGG